MRVCWSNQRLTCPGLRAKPRALPGARPEASPATAPSTGSCRRFRRAKLGESEAEAIDDWQATEVSFTTVRPLATTPVPAQGQAAATLSSGVKLEGHPALKAKARLSSAPLSTRDLGKVTLPRLLYDDPSVCQPLTFTVSRGSDPGLSVLELTDVNDSSVVTPDAPLRMTVPLGLQTNEHVVPVAFDGEFFLPLGRVESRSADETVIALERLPAPLVDSRSLTGAIKIFFQKVISKKVGLDFPYPILGAADVAPDGTVTPVRDTAQVRDRVAKAQRILLFVHGIIGDTESMVPSVQLAKLADARPLASLYDLVLTFDYENLNTTIEDNGRLLKKRLEAVGLGAGHGKSLDIAAHSMGGLVSRWFIEREGGNQIARRLVMLGTPNGGSPWPRIFDWATVALGLGLNHLTAIAWPASVVGGLAAQIENPTVALKEMLPGAEHPLGAEQERRPRHALRHARRQHVDHPGGDRGDRRREREPARAVAGAPDLARFAPQGRQSVLPRPGQRYRRFHREHGEHRARAEATLRRPPRGLRPPELFPRPRRPQGPGRRPGRRRLTVRPESHGMELEK